MYREQAQRWDSRYLPNHICLKTCLSPLDRLGHIRRTNIARLHGLLWRYYPTLSKIISNISSPVFRRSVFPVSRPPSQQIPSQYQEETAPKRLKSKTMQKKSVYREKLLNKDGCQNRKIREKLILCDILRRTYKKVSSLSISVHLHPELPFSILKPPTRRFRGQNFPRLGQGRGKRSFNNLQKVFTRGLKNDFHHLSEVI